MTKVTVKDVFGEVKTYSHDNLKVWRDGNSVEIYFNKSLDGGRDYRKVILAVAVNPARVDIEENPVKESVKPPRETDPFTQEAMGENRPDTPEEKALLDGYKAIAGKRKRRTKAEMEAAKMAEKVVNHEQ